VQAVASVMAFPAEMSATQCASTENLSPALSVKHTTAIAFSAKDSGADAAEEVSPTLRAGGHTGSHANAGVMPAVAFKIGAGAQAGSIGLEEEVSPALTSTDSGTQRSPGMLNAWGVRRLTPTECERLQGFPDGWTQIPWRGKDASACPDGPRYKACGNSMAVNVMCWIGERIQAVAEAADQ
jgi:DNA (cytosine-5)-methyltransferase 1